MKTPLLVLCAALTFAPCLPAENLDAILARMDESAATFKGISADVKMTTFQKVISDETIDTGTLKMQRLPKEKGTRAIIDFSAQSDGNVIFFFGNIVRFYYPKLKHYQDYDVGQNSGILNQFLLLGFGSSGKELVRNYEISASGSEKIAAQETTKLVLIPKDPKAREKLSKVEVWIPAAVAYPAQQQFFEPNGNYRVVRYSNVVRNPPIKGNLEFKLPAGAKKRGS